MFSTMQWFGLVWFGLVARWGGDDGRTKQDGRTPQNMNKEPNFIPGSQLFQPDTNTNHSIFSWKVSILVQFCLLTPFLQIPEGHLNNLLKWFTT